jgi:hypothetical protein
MFKSSVHRYVKLQNFSLYLELSRHISWPLLVNFNGEETWDFKRVILRICSSTRPGAYWQRIIVVFCSHFTITVNITWPDLTQCDLLNPSSPFANSCSVIRRYDTASLYDSLPTTVDHSTVSKHYKQSSQWRGIITKKEGNLRYTAVKIDTSSNFTSS